MLSLPNELLSDIVIATMEYDDIMTMYGASKQFRDIVSTLHHRIYNAVVDRYHIMFETDSILSYTEYINCTWKQTWVTKMEWNKWFRHWMKDHINTRSWDAAVTIKSHLINNHIHVAQQIHVYCDTIISREHLPHGALNYLTEYQISAIVSKYISCRDQIVIRKVINRTGFASNYILNIMIVDYFQLLYTILGDVGIAVKSLIIKRIKSRDMELCRELYTNRHLSDVFKYMLTWYHEHRDIPYTMSPQVKLVMSVYNK